DRKGNPPQFVEMPLIESIFGSYDNSKGRHGGVMEMAQIMINRQLAKDKKDPIYFTDGRGNIVDVTWNGDDADPQYYSEASLRRRENLRLVVGYVRYNEDKTAEPEYVDPYIDDPARYFTKAYVKVRIANFILSHT